MGDMSDDCMRGMECDDYVITKRERWDPGMWVTRNRTTIPVRAMDDPHLLNAFKLSGDTRLLEEIVVRMFVQHIRKGDPHGRFTEGGVSHLQA
jgi:hypothetical protein